MGRSETVRFSSGGVTLVGTLHQPQGSGPHPALLMLQGSGAADRDSDGYFPPIREHFLRHGLAVLSWDKPGIGESTGDWRERTLFDRADEALEALTRLRQQPSIDAMRVGIWGHSQGGWVGPLAASQARHLAFLVVNSGPGIPVHAQDLYGVEHTMRSDGASEADIAGALAFTRALHEASVRGDPYEEVATRLLAPARGTPGARYLEVASPEDWRFLVVNAQRPYEPVAALERITCPVLAIFGERDRLVPVMESVEIFEKAFERAGNGDVTIRVFPEADHRIRVGDPPHFADGYLDVMTDWIGERVSTS